MADKVEIGKSEKGKVVHLIAPGNVAVCDKKLQNLITDKQLKVKDVTCKKCQERKLYKDLLADDKPAKVEKAEPPPEDQKKSQQSIGLPTAKTKPKPKKKPKPKPEMVVTKETEIKTITKPLISEQFEMRENTKTGHYQIVHVPTRKVFFDSIPEEVILDATINLNKIEDWWNSEKCNLPENFIGNCRFALKEAYEQNEMEIPKSLKEVEKPKPKSKSKKVAPTQKTEEFKKGDQMVMVVNGEEVLMEYTGTNWKKAKPKKEEKPKRVLKRRSKEKPTTRTIKRRGVKLGKPEKVKSLRKLKRRSEKKAFLHGCREGTPGYTIAQMLQEGSTAIKMLDKLKEEHGLTAQKAGRKIRGIIKKICRKKGVPICMIMRPNPIEDFYVIHQDVQE